MKKLIIVSLSFLLNYSVYAQFEPSKQVYVSPKLKKEVAAHESVAILPFKTGISYKRVPKNFDMEVNIEEERKLSFNLQSGMYTYLLRKAKDYSVSVQDPERTNALLKKNGMLDRLDEVLADSIAAVLGVDAVIKCTYTYEKTGSEGGAIAKAVLFGAGGSVASGDLTMQIYNGKDGELLWRFYKEMNEGLGSSANELMIRMMKKVGRNFPYEK